MSDRSTDNPRPRTSSGADLSSNAVTLYPFAEHLLAKLAATLLAEHLTETDRAHGDLTNIVVLLPTLHATGQLREALLQQAQAFDIPALLGPTVNTLRGWIETTVPPSRTRLDTQGCELMLVEALEKHPALFGDSSPWLLCESLLELFDELTRHRVTLPDDVNTFIGQLAQAYGADGDTTSLTREAYLVHTLWQAWHRQQHDEGVIDPQSDYIERLAASLATITPQTRIFAAGFYQLMPAEKEWINRLIERGQLQLLLQGDNDAAVDPDDYHPDAVVQTLLETLPEATKSGVALSNFSALLDSVFPPLSSAGSDRTPPLATRAATFAQQHPQSPCIDNTHLYQAESAELEAGAIATQLHNWISEGKKRIAVVTEDRRLARRLRALLERESIVLQDHSGWALSTTRAAATLERWLETVEEDFDQQPLLDTLKSPFVFPNQPRETLNRLIYRFEQDIVLHENIARNLQRYRKHIDLRKRRLGWSNHDSAALHALLNSIESAAAPLIHFIDNRPHNPQQMLDGLRQSLQQIGLWQGYRNDPAGEAIIDAIATMRHALKGRRFKLDWREFRIWLGRTLERANFAPTENSPIKLLTLELSHLQQFDGVVVAAATREHLPGQQEHSPFFNDAVRYTLGIPPAHQAATRRFYHFRRLLESAPHFLLTWHSEDGGEQQSQPSPWVELLQSFHLLGYRQALHDGGLEQLLAANNDWRPRRDDDAILAAPRVVVNSELIPQEISASSYQTLINCPYQFYASHCLNLRAPEEVREALEKADYGEHVHLILQLFHDPQGENTRIHPVTRKNRDTAITRLEALSRHIFRKDLDDNYLHRGWLQQWLRIIPAYIDWQIQRATEWRVSAVETSARVEEFDPLFSIRGRLDRVERREDGDAIVDYKTGRPPALDDIESGEAVQLPFYALLTENEPKQIEYLWLDREKVKSSAVITDQQLTTLAEENRLRLKQLIAEIYQRTPLPAWGDEVTCSFCDMQGLCRKQSWGTDNTST